MNHFYIYFNIEPRIDLKLRGNKFRKEKRIENKSSMDLEIFRFVYKVFHTHDGAISQ